MGRLRECEGGVYEAAVAGWDEDGAGGGGGVEVAVGDAHVVEGRLGGESEGGEDVVLYACAVVVGSVGHGRCGLWDGGASRAMPLLGHTVSLRRFEASVSLLVVVLGGKE